MADLNRKRNIGIIAHIDAGKTTVTERILYYTHKQHKMGEVHEGTATMDWMQEEQERGITITDAATTCYWHNHEINIIDTPGHVDFTIEVERALRVLDGAIGVFCGVAGVQAQSETVWRQAKKYRVPRLAFINKLDRVGADFCRVLGDIERRLDASVFAIQIPWIQGSDFSGVIDLVVMKALRFDEKSLGEKIDILDIPEDHKDKAFEYRHRLLEKLADYDETVMRKFLNNEEVSEDEIKKAVRHVTVENQGVPVLCGAALRNKGIQPVLDAVCDFLPAPVDLPPVRGHSPKKDREEVRECDPEGPFAALAFKVSGDVHGDLTYIRVYSGKVKQAKKVLNVNKGKKEAIPRIWRMHADAKEKMESAEAGDIVAVVGLKYTATGDTLSDAHQPIILERMDFPVPVISMAIEPRSAADKDKLINVLERLAKEDPTFEWRTDDEIGQTIISGMGELHLDVLKHRMLRDFNLQANVGKPQVAYKETLIGEAEADYRFVRQIGERQHYAYVVLKVGPLTDLHKPIVFENCVSKEKIPLEFIPAISEGAIGSAQGGVMTGYPMINIKISLVGGDFDPASSSEVAFSACASTAFHRAAQKAGVSLLEPVMRLEIVVPDEYFGDVMSDLGTRRGEISQVEVIQSKLKVIQVTVPLATMFGYSTAVRSLTQGRATFTMEPYKYVVAPPEIAKSLVI